MTSYQTPGVASLKRNIEMALKSLLEERHLYQRIDIEMGGPWKEALDAAGQWGMGKIQFYFQEECKKEWVPKRPANDGTTQQSLTEFMPAPKEVIDFDLPTIKIFCAACDRAEPFNPVMSHVALLRSPTDPAKKAALWFLGYRCQSCRGLAETFVVHRHGVRLTLCGRFPMEVAQVPASIPKEESRHISRAIVAHQTGYTLAGLFYLRVFIEQYCRRVVAASGAERADQVVERYMSGLEADLKSRFPSLRDIYSRLSDVIHRAVDSAAEFERSLAEIDQHLTAKRLFESVPRSENQSQPPSSETAPGSGSP